MHHEYSDELASTVLQGTITLQGPQSPAKIAQILEAAGVQAHARERKPNIFCSLYQRSMLMEKQRHWPFWRRYNRLQPFSNRPGFPSKIRLKIAREGCGLDLDF